MNNSLTRNIMNKEIKQLLRDPMTLLITVLSPLLAILFRFLIPFISDLVSPYLDLTAFYPMILSLLMLMAPIMYGWVAGFLYLDEKDQELIPNLRITPLSDKMILFEKILIPVIITPFIYFLIIPLSGLNISGSVTDYIPGSLMAILEVPLIAFFLIAFSKDKVQGMTMGKVVSLVLMLPCALFLTDSPLTWLTAFSPPFWLLKAYTTTGSSLLWLLPVGLGYHFVLVSILLRRCLKKMK